MGPAHAAGDREGARSAGLLERELQLIADATERRVSRWVAACCLIASFAALWVACTLSARLGGALTALGLAFAAHYAFVVPHLLSSTCRRPRWLRPLNVTIETTVPFLISVFDALELGPAYALTSTPPLLAFLAISLAALRMSPALALWSAALATLQYLALYAGCRSLLTPVQLEALPTLGWPLALNHAAYLGFGGVLAAISARLARSSAARAFESAMGERRLRGTLGQYLSPEAAERVLSSGAGLQGERRVATVLFADIRGFTNLSSTIPPERAVAFLNAYFDRVCAVVERQGGMVNKFIGDGLLAVFGAPEPQPDHAVRAARAALEMVAAVATLQAPDGSPTRIGVGIHTGEVVLGSIGTERRRDYTVIGDTVNLASRIEGLTKEVGAEVLVSEQTRAACGEALETREIGTLPIRGRDRPAAVHRLVAVRESAAA